jgi:hypothetical protein
VSDWTEFGVREGLSMSARSPVREIPEVAQIFAPFLAENDAALAEPFRGVTTDGVVPTRSRMRTGIATEAIREAAARFLGMLDTPTRSRLSFPFGSNEWRAWFNPHINVYRHGVMLEELSTIQRNAFLDVLRVTLSTRGYSQARGIMRLNDLLAELTGRADDYGEWPYFASFFGVPSVDAPWGFQFDGHHLAINCVVVGNELAMTPTFMGSEPCEGGAGRFAGIRVLDVEERAGLDLIRSLDADQQQVAIQYASIMPDAVPAHLRHPVDNLTQTGAFRDNAVIPYCGIRADGFSDAQRARLVKRDRRLCRVDGGRLRNREDGLSCSASRRDMVRLDGRHRSHRPLLLPAAQSRRADRVRAPSWCGVRQSRAVAASHPHHHSHAEWR